MNSKELDDLLFGRTSINIGTGSSQKLTSDNSYLSEDEVDSLADEASRTYGVPKHLIRGIIDVENPKYDPKAKNPNSSATGLMQTIDSTSKALGINDPTNPRESVFGGTKLLKQLLDKYGDEETATAAYFQGESKVDSYIKSGKTVKDMVESDATGTGTQTYLSKVGEKKQKYQLGGQRDSATYNTPQKMGGDDLDALLFGTPNTQQQQIPFAQNNDSFGVLQSDKNTTSPVMQPISEMQQESQQIAPEQQKKPGVLQDIGNSLTAGAGTVTSGFYSIPAGITSLFLGANNLLNKGINAVTGKKLFKEDYQTPKMLTENKLVQVPKQVAEEASSKVSTKDNDLVELIKKGDVGGTARFLGNWVFEQVPQQAMNMGLLLSGVPNVEALTLMGLTTGGSKEVENKEKVRSGEITQEQSALSVLGNAAFEVGTEAFGDVPVADALKKAFAKKASEVGVEAAKETLGKTFQRVLKGYFGAIKQEVPSEVVATIGQALTDKYSGVNPNLTAEELFSQVVTTAAGTSLMGQAGALGGLQESNTIRAGQKQQAAEQAQLQPIQDKLNADPNFQRTMNAPDLTGTMQPIVDMQGYRDRMNKEQVQGDESIARKIASEQQQVENAAPEGLMPEPATKEQAQKPAEEPGVYKEKPGSKPVLKSIVERTEKDVKERTEAIKYAYESMGVKNIDEFMNLSEEEQGNRFNKLDSEATPKNEKAQKALLEFTRVLDLKEQEKNIDESPITQESTPITPESNFKGKAITFKGQQKTFKGKDVSKEYVGEIVGSTSSGKFLKVNVKNKDGSEKLFNVPVSRITEIDGVENIPESIVIPKEEDTGPQEITATEDQLNVGKDLVKNLKDVEFQGSNPGFKGINKKTGKEVVVQPTYEFKDKVSGGNITLYEEQLNEDVLTKKLAEKRGTIEVEKTEDRKADSTIQENTGILNKVDNVKTTDVPSVQPVTEKQEESTVSPAIERPPEQKAEIEAINTNPTEPQKEAGNYRKAHIKLDGMDISIENAAGQERKGTDKTGKEWKVTMNHDYGYILGTKGAEWYRNNESKDQVDVFINPGAETEGKPVFVIDQVDPKTGAFDEAKVMMGFDSAAEAQAAYHENYERWWKGFGAITEMTLPEFKEWVYSEATKEPVKKFVESQKKLLKETGVTEKENVGEIIKGDEILFDYTGKGNFAKGKVMDETEYTYTIKTTSGDVIFKTKDLVKPDPDFKRPVEELNRKNADTDVKLPGYEDKNFVARKRDGFWWLYDKDSNEIVYGGDEFPFPSKESLIESAKENYKPAKKQTGATENKLESTNNIKGKTDEKEVSKKTETVLNKEVETPSSDPNTQLVNDYVQLIKTHHGNKEKIPNTRKILDLADKAHGGTIAEGKYGIRDAYDALETAMNKYVDEIGLDEDPKETIKKLNNAIKVLPTQTVRTEDQVEKQQFSTPPSEAYLAVMASGIKEGMTGLEPSAGDGNIATIMRLANKGKGEIYTNEIDERRRNNLKVLGFNPTDADAEYLHSTLPKEIQPDVVVMNPPFSATGGRLKQHDTGFGAEHVRQALLRLKDGGRLVAIVGNGMAFGKPKMASWWNGIRDKYNVRANVGISGKEYEKYGTGFDNNIIVIDKTGKTGSIQDIVTGSDLTVEKAYDLLEPLMKEDVNGRIKRDIAGGTEKVGSKKPEGKTSEEKSTVGSDITPPVGSGRGSNETTGTGTNKAAVEGMGKSGNKLSGESGTSNTGKVTEGGESAEHVKNGSTRNAGPDENISNGDTGGSERKSSGEGRVEEEENSVYAKYTVKKATYPGSVPHQANIVESATMASVDLPNVTYKLNIPKEIIKKGAPSDIQLEAATYAGQTHEQLLPDGRRKEYLLGDSTGTGKTITILTTIYDNWMRGRKKAVVITKSKGLIKDLRDDMKMMGIDIPVIDLSEYKMSEAVEVTEGILFSTYATASGEWTKGRERYNQIKNWFGKDNDGVFVFDEAHLMKNASAETPTNTGSMGIKFKDELKNARFLNASATAATNSKNLAYLTRMGLWGEGSSFKNFNEFLGTMTQGGLGAMELLSRDMKANGNYISRTISYKGVDYETLNHTMNETEIASYNSMADFWSEILQRMDEAAKNSGLKGRSARNHAKQYYAAQQRFFLQLMVSFQVETMLKDADKKLNEGKSVVISLFNTNEQQTEKKVGDAQAQGVDIDDMDFTPRDMMIDMIKKNFPVDQYQEVQRDDGTKEYVKVTDKAGNPLKNAENEAIMNELVDKVATFKMPDNPMDRIVNYFGEGKVSEVTGRKKRLVMVNGKKVYKARATKDVSAKDVNRNELDQFMDGKKRVAVLSGAAATGFSFHSSTKKKNQQRRVFYALQLSWSADQQMQAFGRVHRTMQANAPEIVLVQTDIASQKRLVNTIQSRLASLGAISKGERESLSGGIFSIEDITDEYGDTALRDVLSKMSMDKLKRMGLVTETGKSKEVDVDGFLNRLMVLQVKDQNEIFDQFYGKYRDAVDKAKEAGLYDTGVEKIKGENVRIEGEPILLSDDKQSGVKTEILNIAHDVETVKRTFKQANERLSGKKVSYVRNKKSGDPYMAYVQESDIHIYGPRWISKKIPYTQVREEFYDKYEKVEDGEFEKLWNEKYKEIPKVSTHHTHIVTGSIFNNYKKIFEASAEGSFSNLKVKRAVLDNGVSKIGVYIPQSMIEKIKQNFGIGTDLVTASPEKIVELVRGGSIIEFDNRWKLKKSKVMGDERIELNIGNDYNTGYIEKMGLFNEIIAGQKRYFVPTGDTMIETIKNIMDKTKPVRDLTVKSEESAMASAPLFERDVTKENQIYTTEFKEWFGDWENDPENASKVVDENGKPLVVYHGTDKKFNIFDASRAGETFGADQEGIFFTSDIKEAEYVAEYKADGSGREKVYTVYLDIKNPYKYKTNDVASIYYDNHNVEILIAAHEAGNDGIIIEGRSGGMYVVFDSNQIKSATENKGTFKKNNPNIYASAFAVPTFKITDLAKSVTPAPVKVNPVQTVKSAPSGKKLQYAQASNKLGNQITDKEDKSRRDTGFISKAEAFYQKWVDLAFPISKVEDIYNEDMGIKRETAREIDIAIDRVRGAGGMSKQFIDDNLKPIFDNIKENKGEVSAELSKYLVAVRTKWLYENKKSYADIGIDKGTADDFVEFIDTGAHPYSSIIKESAQKVWEYGKKLLEIKKEHGIIDDELSANLSEPFYVPFYRSFQDEKIAKSVPRGERFTTISKGIKKIKGSLTGRKIIDPVQNMMEHTYETMVNAYRADVANLLVDMAEESEAIGEMFQKINPKWVKVGTIEHRGTMDVVLRPQIDEVAKELGITTEYKTKLAARIGRKLQKVLGKYEAGGKLQMLIGATEETYAHELGHGIHEKYSWYDTMVEKYDTELNAVADTRHAGVQVPVNFVKYCKEKSEKAAEFISLYITDRDSLKTLAPKMLVEFEGKIQSDPVLKKLIAMKPSNVKGLITKEENNFVMDWHVPQDADVISVLREGKIVSYKVPIEVADAVKNLHPAMFPAWFRIMMMPNRVLKRMAVSLNLDFMFPNMFRDQQEAAINARTIPAVDWLIGLKEYAFGGDYLKRYFRAGGGMESVESGVRGFSKSAENIKYGSSYGKFLDTYYWQETGKLRGAAQLSLEAFKSPFKIVEKLAETSEMASRIGTFRRAQVGYPEWLEWYGGKKKSEEQAIHIARQATLDFQRFGSHGRTLNEVIPFLNAAIQGIDRMVRTFKDDYKRALLSAMVYAITPAIGLFLWNRDKELYKAINFQEKLNNFIVMLPDGSDYVKIPKGHITKFIINPIQAVIEKLNGTLTKENGSVVVDLLSDISPVELSSLPITLRIILEPVANYDFYWKKQIETPAMQGISKAGLRTNSRTSYLIKQIGKAINISPAMIQHETELLGAGTAKNALWVADNILVMAGVSDGSLDAAKFGVERAPIARRFYGKVTEWGSDIDEAIRDVNTQLSKMNETTIRQMRGRLRYSDKEINEVIKSNNELKSKLYIKRGELEKAKGAITELLKNQE